jgi:hypothetical protein
LIAALICPGVTARLMRANLHLFHQRITGDVLLFCLPICVLLASLGAYLRVEDSNGRLRGARLAILAMVLSGLWLIATITVGPLFSHAVRNMH